MSQSINSNEKTFLASEDLSAKQYYIMQMDSSGDCEIGEGATDLLIGVLQNTPESGQAANVRFAGTSKVLAAGAISIGDWVTTDSAGKAVATTTDKNVVIGKALEAATNAGDIIEIEMSIFTLSV